MVMSCGYGGLWYPVCYACGYLFLLLFIAGPLRRFGEYTIPDSAEGRFDSPVFRKIAVVFVLFIGFVYTMPQMKGAGTTLAYIFPGLPYWAGVVLVGAVITLNVALGGMKGITLVQAFQYWAKMFAISVPVFVLMSVYGHYGKQLALEGSGPATTAAVVRKPLPDKAPKDDLWISPFGPLTTKAAKAVAATISNRVDLSGKLPLRAGLAPEAKLTANLDGISLRRAVLMYAEVTGTKSSDLGGWKQGLDEFFGGRLSRWHVVKMPVRPPSGIVFHGDGRWTAGELKESLETILQTNKVAVSVDQGNVLRLVKADAARQATVSLEMQRAWLSTHERPLALLYTYSLMIALVCGTAGLPHILVRFYTNPDGVAAKRTTMWVMILIGVFYLFPPIFGVMGRNLMPELYNGLAGVKGTDGVVLRLPTILDPQKFGPLGSVLSGITCAGAFAAFMSTFSGLLVSIT